MTTKHLRNNGLLDLRWKCNRLEGKEFLFWHKNGSVICAYLLAILSGFIFGSFITSRLYRASQRPIINPRGVSEVKTVLADTTPYCYDPITCIRDVGEELNQKNQDILTMIRIAKCESGLRPEATNLNWGKSLDRGIFQINSIHTGLSNKDAFDFEKNIRYAWKIFISQGTTPWNSSRKCWNK